MSDSANSVHVLQHHLRQAGTLIAAERYDEASAHVEAALALDPASLAALTLRERIQTRRTAADLPGGLPPVPDAVRPSRFVPYGVDAASWLDFEQRVEERRFRALLNGAQRAISAGDAVAARTAIEEARELRPDAYEVSQLSGRVALLPSLPIPARIPYHRSRTVRAASMLAVGVLLLLGVDWARSGDSSPAAAPDLAVNLPTVPVPPLAEPTPSQPAPPASQMDRVVEVTQAATSEPVGTAGAGSLLPVVTSAPRQPVRGAVAIPVGAVAPASLEASPPLTKGETSDVYVAPAPRRVVVQDAEVVPQIVRTGESLDAPSGFRPPAPAQRDTVRAEGPQAGGAANVVRQPASVIEALGTPVPGRATSTAPAVTPAAPAPEPAAAASAAIATAALDETRVQNVLDRYAQAYGRLDARAVRAVWPSVDERALARAFSDLESQSVSFDACDIDVHGASATAACRGTARYVRRIGSQNARTEPRTVRFALTRSGEEWRIDKAETRR